MIVKSHSLTEENYLKAIVRLSQKGDQKISVTAIAEAVGVNAASAIDMVKKLADKNLIVYDKSKGAELTKTGKDAAIAIVRSHRLWEVFLLDKLGYSWDVVHDIAEQLEHVKHPELSARLEKYLGYPEYDPHGDPIPTSSGELPPVSKITLAEIEIGRSCQVVAVKDTSSSFLQYLLRLSVHIGTTIKVLEKIPFDGSIIIQTDKNQKISVSYKFGENLIVA